MEMLREAIEVIRLVWKGGDQSYYGSYYTVENARIYTIPKERPPILIAGAGPKAAQLAGRAGDGFIGTSPKSELLYEFNRSGGEGKPCYGEVTVCWASDEGKARRTAHERWPIAAMEGELLQELRVPAHFEQTAKMITEGDIAKSVVCGPDPQRHIEAIETYADAGYDHVWIHQIGPDQEGFFRFYEDEVLPRFAGGKSPRSQFKQARA